MRHREDYFIFLNVGNQIKTTIALLIGWTKPQILICIWISQTDQITMTLNDTKLQRRKWRIRRQIALTIILISKLIIDVAVPTMNAYIDFGVVQ